MEQRKNIEQLLKEASRKLLESIALVDVLADMFDGDYKEDTLLGILRSNIHSAFHIIEQSRKHISVNSYHQG